ncbi:hypothetical protein FNV43_RR19662 [Rhamnella rubrinervis]|uniref:F-box domain-containing protein n=1 Tax=Rhamnella rubrinervis TaxID=2594499 RepID=A0A8K0DZN6_9ROSA|nr:hypothetical protein FNV43_RR19662 [Rhamnella rubrinervis]
MLRSCYLPYVKSWSSIVSHLVASGNDGPSEALKLFNLVTRHGRQFSNPKLVADSWPHTATYNSALNACANLGETKRFLQLFVQMSKFRAKPDVLTYNVMFKLCAIAYRKDLLVFVLERILKKEIPFVTIGFVERMILSNVSVMHGVRHRKAARSSVKRQALRAYARLGEAQTSKGVSLEAVIVGLGLTVSEFKGNDVDEWNVTCFIDSFVHEYVADILRLAWPPIQCFDKLRDDNKYGCFSVRHCFEVDQNFDEGCLKSNLWRKLWRSKLHERIKMFLWRLLAVVLPAEMFSFMDEAKRDTIFMGTVKGVYLKEKDKEFFSHSHFLSCLCKDKRRELLQAGRFHGEFQMRGGTKPMWTLLVVAVTLIVRDGRGKLVWLATPFTCITARLAEVIALDWASTFAAKCSRSKVVWVLDVQGPETKSISASISSLLAFDCYQNFIRITLLGSLALEASIYMDNQSPASTTRNDKLSPATTCFAAITDDLLQNIISKLNAASFASAACVNKSWYGICNRVLSRPKLASALSLHPSPHIAVRDVLDKVLAEPIRPDFAIANVGSAFPLFEVLKIMSKKLGSKTPMIISTASGISGRDAITDKFKEVKWLDFRSDFFNDDDGTEKDENYGILLTIGYVPGLKVDAIPLLRSTKEPLNAMDGKFVMDIRDYTVSVSGCTAPVGIVLFGEGLVDIKGILNMLDYTMPLDTVIVGDEKGRFLYRSGDESRNVCGSAKYLTDAVALIFARDKEMNCGNIRFHVGLSNGISAVGPRYKPATLRACSIDRSTRLTARIEGHQKILDGQGILNDINNRLASPIDFRDLYIGVVKPGNSSTRSEKPSLISSLECHGVLRGNDKYLVVDGDGLRYGDCFQFCHFDPDTALSSKEVFGGFIFSYSGQRINIERSSFVKNFPELPLAGILCGREIGRGSITLTEEGQKGRDGQCCCMHVFCPVYLVMSYTPLQHHQLEF